MAEKMSGSAPSLRYRDVGMVAASPPANDLESQLKRIMKAASEVWPLFEVPEALFRSSLVGALPEGVPVEESLESIHAEDLYLAIGCGLGLREAIVALEELCFGDIAKVIRRHFAHGPLAIVLEDVAQMLREKLFVAEEGQRAKIMEYSGRGPLRGWFRVVATRLTLNLATRGPKDIPAAKHEDGALLDLADCADGADVAYMRALYSEELRLAFPQAFARLSVHERLLLRQKYLDGLSLDEMSRLHAVHRATIKRQLAHARETVGSALRELLGARLGLSSTDIESMLESLRSRFHLSLSPILSPQMA